MTRRRHALALLAAAALPACGGVPKAAAAPAPTTMHDDAYPPTPPGPSPGASAAVQALAASLGRGINFGNMLDAPNEGDWGLRVEEEFLALIGTAGFTRSVRLPVRWSNHATADATARINLAFFARVDAVVDTMLARGCTVMLNMHHYHQLDGDALDRAEFSVDPAVVKLRFFAMWQQIAERYAKHSDRLIFEVYNEPHGAQEADWNDRLSRAVRLIRQSNPTRALVVGPTQWNSANALAKLTLPADANLILTVHHYEPFDFTHQGAAWMRPVKPTGVDCCSAAQTTLLTGLLDLAVKESARLGYPCFVGEFGAYKAAPEAASVRYLRLMRTAMEARGLSWFYWELAAGFGVYDPAAHAFRAPLKEALYGA